MSVPVSLVLETVRLLQEAGTEGMEAIVVWAGFFTSETTFEVDLVIRPAQTARRTNDGLLVTVDEQSIFDLNRRIADEGRRLIAQIHSHPTEAYHSSTDEEYSLVTAIGGLSLVVPFFGSRGFDLHSVAVYRLNHHGEWCELNGDEARRLVNVVEDR